MLMKKQNTEIIDYINENLNGSIKKIQGRLSDFVSPNSKEKKLISNSFKKYVREIFKQKYGKGIQSHYTKNKIYDNIEKLEIPENVDRSSFGSIAEISFSSLINDKYLNYEDIINDLKSSNAKYIFNTVNEIDLKHGVTYFLRNKKAIYILKKRSFFLKNIFKNKIHDSFTNSDDEMDFYVVYEYIKECDKKTNYPKKKTFLKSLKREMFINQNITDRVYKWLDQQNVTIDKLKQKFKTSSFYHNKFKNIIISFELDLYTKDSIVEIKTSTKEFKIDWFYQMLLYHFCLLANGFKNKYICLYNLTYGNFYKVKVSDFFNEKDFLNYLKTNKVI